MSSILVITDKIMELPEKAAAEIKRLAPDFDLKVVDSRSDYSQLSKKSEIIYGLPEVDLVKKAENLKWLQLPTAGVNGYAEAEIYQNSDIILTNASGVYGRPIAEHVFGMILAHNRNLIEHAADKKGKIWQNSRQVKDFFGSTVGILGLGDIGSTIAERAKNWGARVLALKRTKSSLPAYVDQIYLREDLDLLLKESDYLILTLPGTPETEGIIAERELKLMKSSAFLVNIGRGSLIKEEALVKALKNNWISGAGLDVTETEPLPKESELWELDNLLLTPHISGQSPTNDQHRFAIFKDNLKKYLQNKNLSRQVDFKLKY